MEIDITSLADLDASPLSHSQAEGGPTAGPDTWNAAKQQAQETALLDTQEKLDAFREWVRPSGGWTREEIDNWTPQECNAHFLQWIAGDIREAPGEHSDRFTFTERNPGEWYREDETHEWGPYATRSEAYQDTEEREPRAESLDDIDWLEYEAQASEGQISSNLFRADDGRIYFSLSH
jgi:hypothetical protein